MRNFRLLVLLLGDAFVIALSFLVSGLLIIQREEFAPYDPGFFMYEDAGLIKISIVTLILLLSMYFVGLHERIRVRSRRQLAEDLVLVYGVAFLVQAFTSYFRISFMLPRAIMLLGALLSFAGLMGWRILYSFTLLRLVGRQKVLFLGDTPLARRIAERIVQAPEEGFQVVGCIADPTAEPVAEPFPGGPIIPVTNDLPQVVTALSPDKISVSSMLRPEDALAKHMLWFSSHGFQIENVGDLYEALFQRVALETVSMNQLVFSTSFRVPLWMLLSQRVYGSVISIIGLLLTWPLMLLTALAVRLDSEGPALLRQKRTGKNGKVFEILKFRSMYVDADKRFGRSRASENDPRITRVGRFIRVTRLDELPQFINVLRGDMNLVGPRPEMPIYVEEICREVPLYAERHRVLPGITGWAQIHHEPEYSILDTRRKIEYDLYYIKNLSPFMDCLIIFHTLKAVMMRTGAR